MADRNLHLFEVVRSSPYCEKVHFFVLLFQKQIQLVEFVWAKTMLHTHVLTFALVSFTWQWINRGVVALVSYSDLLISIVPHLF